MATEAHGNTRKTVACQDGAWCGPGAVFMMRRDCRGAVRLAMNCACRQANSAEKGLFVVATAKACRNSLCAMAILITFSGLPEAFKRVYRALQAGLQRFAVQLHRYSSCRIRPCPSLAIDPLPLTEVPDRKVVGLTPIYAHRALTSSKRLKPSVTMISSRA